MLFSIVQDNVPIVTADGQHVGMLNRGDVISVIGMESKDGEQYVMIKLYIPLQVDGKNTIEGVENGTN